MLPSYSMTPGIEAVDSGASSSGVTSNVAQAATVTTAITSEHIRVARLAQHARRLPSG